MNIHSNSKSVSKILYMGSMSEPLTDPETGIYFGKTRIYKLPFFIDVNALINPHFTVIGMSGSGKSYALKAIIARGVLQNRSNVLVLDWNNEYKELMQFLSGRVLSLGTDFMINIFDLYAHDRHALRSATELVKGMAALDDRQHSFLYSKLSTMLEKGKHMNLYTISDELNSSGSEIEKELALRLSQLSGNPLFAKSTNFKVSEVLEGSYSINLSTLKDDAQRSEVARFMLRMVTEAMHEMPLAGNIPRMIVLDEAWRLIRNSAEVGILFREARKYGISLIAATQLASDINNEVIANSGCIAVFRLQSETDYQTLESMGLIDQNARKVLGELGVGSCMLSLAYKGSQMPSKFFIEKVCGVEHGLVTLRGIGMKKVNYGVLEEVSESMLGMQRKEKVLAFVAENGREIGIKPFVKFLHGTGLSRPDVVCYLHELGISDREIVDAYET